MHAQMRPANGLPCDHPAQVTLNFHTPDKQSNTLKDWTRDLISWCCQAARVHLHLGLNAGSWRMVAPFRTGG